MSLKVEYKGQFYLDLPIYLSIADGYSLGEKLTQIEKEAKKKFIEMLDEEIYTTLRYLTTTKEYFKDEKLNEEEFKEWVDGK